MTSKISLSEIKSYLRDNQTLVLRRLFYLWCAYEFVLGLVSVFWRSKTESYFNMGVSDWMINYQGGFVRRGISGEILYQLYQLHPYPLRTMIYCIMTATFFLLLGLLYQLFKKNGWSYILFPSCVLIVQGFTNYQFCTRKDYIMLLGAFLVFWMYRQWERRILMVWSYLAMQVVAIMLMLIHEASMFFTIPILFCDYAHRQYCSKNQNVIH